MYLSRLELFGFKSFAQRVQIKFDSGLTAIVGPNGCGKTNLVDAIRWVLGEQKTSVLRSDKMENVIFNGTKTRKPLGMSEVSITIENTRNILPTEYSEVTITRRLYRNGESEYLLNKVPCRLKDITDLFADTGMGSDAYSVIELKMIEQILSENAEERRRLFEEAAGITKYKQRRKQTFKKLETTSQDLSRVQDIVLEVEKKVSSLERQAKKAEQFRQLKTELRELEVAIAERELASLYRLIVPLSQRLSEHEKEKLSLTTQIDTLDAELQQKAVSLLEVEKALAAVQKELSQQTERITATEKQIFANEERTKSLAETIQRAEAELASLQTQLGELLARQLALQEELRLKELELQQAQETFSAQRRAFAASEQQLREQRLLLEQTRSSAAELSKKSSTLALEIQSIQSRIENLDSQRQQYEARQKDLAQKIQERETYLQSTRAALAQAQDALLAATVAFSEAKQRRTHLQAELDSHKEQLLQARAERDRTAGRIAVLQSLLESYEGLPEGVKFLDIDAQKRFGLGSLADLVSTDEEYKLALAAALGEAQSFYVSPTADSALQAIEMLRASAKGKLTFAVLEHFAALTLPEPALPPSALRLLDVVRCAPEIRPLLAALIGHIIIADDFAHAHALLQTAPHLEAVTRSGERYSLRGFVRGGSIKESEGLRIGKREEMERLLSEQHELNAHIEHLEQYIATLQRTIGDIRLAEMEQEIRRTELSITELEKRLSQAEFERSSFETESAELAARLATLASEKIKFEQTLAMRQPEQAELNLQLSELSAALEVQQRLIGEREQAVQAENAALQQQSLRLKEAEFSLEKTRSALQNLEQEQLAKERQKERLTLQIEQNRDEIFRLRAELETMNANLRVLYAQRDTVQTRLAELEGTLSSLKGEISAHEAKLRDLSRQREVVSHLILEFQQQISHNTVKAEHIRTVIKTEYDLELEQKEFPEHDDFQISAAQERVQQLRQKLKSLGPINELALQEFQEEKARLEFLTSQRDDLLNAEKQLRDTIEEINKTAIELFNKTFQAIRQNFITIFRELFSEGDEADLLLKDPQDPLESDIEIIAKPKGKRPQAITLLSGGEKTLTATALLFAIYLVKPSPFCILDEVDAPLDDANIDRFVRLIKKFSKDTQFIIVTHNKRTMEAANTLYGVTMEEEGVSKLVAARLDDLRKN
ncbi:MAG: chromosome segregation protein SMC [Chloroherpetonaceae bacterium]|nr:chromosome segregation protein SMC [Chloroherpetonaceae bacterium]